MKENKDETKHDIKRSREKNVAERAEIVCMGREKRKGDRRAAQSRAEK